jgi:hypothetical protein
MALFSCSDEASVPPHIASELLWFLISVGSICAISRTAFWVEVPGVRLIFVQLWEQRRSSYCGTLVTGGN